ncbi:MAG: sulfatase family protein [Gemmataceae bacterium]
MFTLRRSRLALIVLCLLGSSASMRAAESEKWNIVSIVTDDQGAWALGCYGNKECRTPNMDRLAREGARFLNAFTPTPVCSPSRASMLCGLYGSQVGITDWIAPKESDAGMGLPPNVPTWPKILHQHCYRTAVIGKWHLGTQPRFHPTKNGFDHFFGFLAGGNQPMDPVLEKDGKTRTFKGPLPDLLTDDALQFLSANKAQPFALLLHFRAPHLPYGPVPAVDSKLFKELDPAIPAAPGIVPKQVKNWTRNYYASIHSVDRNLGRLLAKLDELGLSKKTIVLFTSDHGYNIGQHTIHTKGNGYWIAGGVAGPKRPNMWDTSIRVPLLIRWPGVVKPGAEFGHMVTFLDLAPSILGMLDVASPREAKWQGMDFTPVMRGRKNEWRNTVFGQYDLHNGGLAYMRMIRTSQWKLIRHHHANGLDELYNLEDDPGETRNLYGRAKHAAVRDQLQQRLSAWQKSIDDPLLREARNSGR